MTDSKTIFSDFERRRAIREDANAKNKAALFDCLATLGINRVTVSFDGEGDSGQMEEITAFRGEEPCRLPARLLQVFDAGQDEVAPVNRRLEAAIESLCYDFLSEEHDGWENNEGACGVFEFDVVERSVELELAFRIVDIHTITHTF